MEFEPISQTTWPLFRSNSKLMAHPIRVSSGSIAIRVANAASNSSADEAPHWLDVQQDRAPMCRHVKRSLAAA